MLESLLAADIALHNWLLALPHPTWLTVVMVLATLAGRGGLIWVGLGVYRALRDRAHGPALFRLILALLVTFVLVDFVLKPLVGRERPSGPGVVAASLLGPPTSASFPSGHAAAAVAGAYALSRFWRRAAVPLWILAALVAVSRVYLGVHYPADVLAGAVVGALVAVLVTGGAPSGTTNQERRSTPV